jgi:hypothetical protein
MIQLEGIRPETLFLSPGVARCHQKQMGRQLGDQIAPIFVSLPRGSDFPQILTALDNSSQNTGDQINEVDRP